MRDPEFVYIRIISSRANWTQIYRRSLACVSRLSRRQRHSSSGAAIRRPWLTRPVRLIVARPDRYSFEESCCRTFIHAMRWVGHAGGKTCRVRVSDRSRRDARCPRRLRPSIPTQMYIDGEWCDARERQDAGRDQSGGRVGRWPRWPTGRGRGGAGDRGGGAGVSRVAGAVGLRSRQDPEKDRRADARPRRPDRPDPDPGTGKAAGRGQDGGPARGRHLRVVRRGGEARLRPDHSADEYRQATLCDQASGRRRRHDHALELPGRPAQPQDRAGAGRRLHGREPAGRSDAADLDPDVRVPGRRRIAARGRQPGDRPVAADRRRVLRAPGGAQDQLHRLDRGRQGADPALGRPGQAAEPRAGRPRPADRLPRRRRRSRSPRPPSSASSATTGRSASPRRGSTSTRRSPRTSPRRPSS